MINTGDNLPGIAVNARFTLSLLAKALQGDQEPGLDPNVTLTYDEGEGVRFLIAEVDRALGAVLNLCCTLDLYPPIVDSIGDSPPVQ